MTVHRCARCFAPVEVLTVKTQAGHAYDVPLECERCPRLCWPCCPFCDTRLDSRGLCENVDCFFVGCLVPVPVLRPPWQVRSIPPPPRPNTPRQIRR